MKPPKPPPPNLSNLGTTALERWTAIDAPPIVGTQQAFDVDANFDWASSIAIAWRPDAKLYRLHVGHIGLDGAVDLSPGSPTDVEIHFNSSSNGDVDLSVDVFPYADRRAGAATVKVVTNAHKDTTSRHPVAKPKCLLARALTALRGTGALAKADPKFRVEAELGSDGSKASWHFVYVVQSKSQSTDVDATTCAITK